MEQPKIERILRLIKLMTGNTNLTVDDLTRVLRVHGDFLTEEAAPAHV